ncbi:MAG: DUF2726 domain-containing protein [Clostridiales bacterium]|nr:DUF2726 domain-containing protein [Clostridiales bacterium]
MKRLKTKTLLLLFLLFTGLTVFAVSLLPFFKDANEFAWIATIVGAALMIIAVVGLLVKRGDGKKVVLSSEYVRKKQLLTPPEQELYAVLKRINPDRYEVIPQTALVNVIDKKTNASYRNELFRVCDFCFVDRRTFEPLLLVELNDSSHNRADRVERDEKVAAICEDAGLPLVTFWMDDDLSPSFVKREVKRKILR